MKKLCICQLPTLKEMGDSKPSQFLRHLSSLTQDMQDDILHSIWSSQLAINVQAILAAHRTNNNTPPDKITSLPYHLNHWIDNSSFYGTQQSKYLSPII
jgi:hypothetical protein